MYGLVNKAIQGLIVEEFGDEKWEAIKKRAGVTEQEFVSMCPYSDSITYGLVEAASEVLGLPAEQILETFGEYWTRYTANEGYGELMNMAGDNLVEFLQNLDNLHARVGLSFPQLRPPSFRCTDITASSLRLHYHSERSGLAPLVVGLLKGLGTRFDTHVEVKLEPPSGAETDGHDVFVVEFQDM